MSTVLFSFFLFLHFLGMGALFGGLLAQVGEKMKKVDRAVVYGALLQLVSGAVLVALSGETVDHFKVAVKTLLLLCILLVLFIYRRRELAWDEFNGLLFLVLLTIGLSVFWR